MEGDKRISLPTYKRHVFVCTGPRCAPETSKDIYEALKVRLKELKVDQRSVRRTQAQCFGICQGGPIVLVYPDGVWYHHVTAEMLSRIIDEHVMGGKPISDWAIPVG